MVRYEINIKYARLQPYLRMVFPETPLRLFLHRTLFEYATTGSRIGV